MQLNRRKFILTGLIAAPAVIAVNHLMPIRPWGREIHVVKGLFSDAGFFFDFTNPTMPPDPSKFPGTFIKHGNIIMYHPYLPLFGMASCVADGSEMKVSIKTRYSPGA